jgi:hypothetical protein
MESSGDVTMMGKITFKTVQGRTRVIVKKTLMVRKKCKTKLILNMS